MKKFNLKIILLIIGTIISSASIACTPNNFTTCVKCQSYINEQVKDCIQDAKDSLHELEGGADTYQQRQSYLELIHSGCQQRYENKCNDCPN